MQPLHRPQGQWEVMRNMRNEKGVRVEVYMDDRLMSALGR